MRVVIIVKGNTNLLEIVRALHTPRGLARGLYRREQQSNEDTDNRDNDKEFNQSEPFFEI